MAKRRKPKLEQQFGERIGTLFSAAFPERIRFIEDHLKEMGFGEPSSLNQYITEVSTGRLYRFLSYTKPNANHDVQRRRMATFLTLLNVPGDDPAVRILQQIDPDFTYPHQKQPKEPEDTSRLEEKIGWLDEADRRVVNRAVDRLLQNYE